jgi:hypothetical protein
VTTIEPISAAMPAPTRVASIMAPMSGAKFRMRISANDAPIWPMSGTMRWICRPAWKTVIIPRKPITVVMKKSERLPIWWSCSHSAPRARRPRTA